MTYFWLSLSTRTAFSSPSKVPTTSPPRCSRTKPCSEAIAIESTLRHRSRHSLWPRSRERKGSVDSHQLQQHQAQNARVLSMTALLARPRLSVLMCCRSSQQPYSPRRALNGQDGTEREKVHVLGKGVDESDARTSISPAGNSSLGQGCRRRHVEIWIAPGASLSPSLLL